MSDEKPPTPDPHPAIVVQACVWYYWNVDPREQLEAASGSPLDRWDDVYREEKLGDYQQGFVHWFNRFDAERQRAWVDAALRRFAVDVITAPLLPDWITPTLARSFAELFLEHASRLEAEAPQRGA